MSRRAAGVPIVAAAHLLAGLFAPASAAAEDKGAQTPDMDVRTIRSGLVVALNLGWGISGASGYPNNSTEVGNPSYYSSSNLLAGTGSAFFIGGALADYLNFGFWFGGENFRSNNWTSKGAGGGFRVELFPLISLVPSLKGLGAFAQFGLGSATLAAKGDYPEAKGFQSFIGLGALYEFTLFHLLGGHGVLGPTLEYDTIYASTISSGAGLLGARFAFYGGM
jgi:hypothetical protein